MVLSVPGEVADMVRLLVGERVNESAMPGCEPRSQVWVAEQAGVHRHTVGEWERGEKLPSLRHFVLWAGVLGYRVVLTDNRDLRWNKGFQPFGQRQWSDPALVERFTELELVRVMHALKRARVVTGTPVWQITKQIGCSDLIGRWESGAQTPRMDHFIRWAGALGLCALIERAEEISDEAPDEDPAALRPDEENEGAPSCP
jgi:transcriptional regulator with XRE-family HTH domain